MLNDQQTYKKLKKDPRNVCEKEMKKLLSSKAERMDEKLLKKLKTTDGPTLRIYGLPKIHKNNNPLRPIVSFSGSTTYQLSKYLSLILSPLVGKTENHIRNTYEWVNKAKQWKLNNDKELISFDVISLFTLIPTDLALDVAFTRLENDPTLRERTLLMPQDIIELLAFCLNSTEFQFRENFYKQIHGIAMGSPVSVVVANLVMEHLETKALDTFP
jgi:hypothetical protein